MVDIVSFLGITFVTWVNLITMTVPSLRAKATAEASLALAEINGWTAATRKKTRWNYSGDFFYERPISFRTLSDTVDAALSLLDERERGLQIELEEIKKQREEFQETLLLRPDPTKCHCELVSTVNHRNEWGGADYKVVCSRRTVFDINEGWLYSSSIPVYTTYYRSGGHATRHINHS